MPGNANANQVVPKAMDMEMQPIVKEPKASSDQPVMRGEETDKEKVSMCAVVGGILCCPATLCYSWFQVQEKTNVVILHCGTYTGIVTEPGCHWVNCCGRENHVVDVGIISHELKNTKIIEKSGTPIIVGAVVTYRIVNAKRAVLDVQSYKKFIQDKAITVLKQVVSRYPYQPSKATPGEPSLLTETKDISHEMETEFGKVIAVAGAEVISFQLNEISYAPEIASAMLKRQQASAVIDAREAIVKGAVNIALDSMDALKAGGVTFTPEEQANLVSNLLVVTSSDQGAAPVVNVGTS
eukprot:m.296748 g.296748  ORF g.296748 m.296748 type:complete len:296 (-) comp16393_c7_seq1:1561-2448(-)